MNTQSNAAEFSIAQEGRPPSPLDPLLDLLTNAPANTAEFSISDEEGVFVAPVITIDAEVASHFKAGVRKWSDEQVAIIEEGKSGRGHLVVEALAGTGKTTTIMEFLRVAPETARSKSVYLAFNRKNVVEAKDKAPAGVEVKSFHQLGYKFVLYRWKGVKADDQVEGDRVDSVLKGREYPQAYQPRASILKCVARAKNTAPLAKGPVDLARAWDDAGCEIGAQEEEIGWTVELGLQAAYATMQAAKVRDPKGRISFDDMIWLPVAMRWVSAWFDLVAGDEAQDLNATQMALVRGACRPGGRIALIGDRRQAIYGFRGADSEGISRFIAELKAKVLTLTTTYRCGKAIVELAQKLVPAYRAADSAHDGLISECSGSDLIKLAQPGDAILGRTNAPLVGGCLAFLRAGKRAYVEGRDVGRELIAAAEKIGKGARTTKEFVAKLATWEKRQVDKALAGGKDVEKKVENIQDKAETLRVVAEESTTLADFHARLQSLFSDSENGKASDSVVFSTVHKAKGLEWTRTFLLRDTFRKISLTPEVSEEQNILYVAMTRAKQEMSWVVGAVSKKKQDSAALLAA